MTKKFDIINIEDGWVMVDKEVDILHSDYVLFKDKWVEHITPRDRVKGDKVQMAEPELNYKIIAHTGIPLLKDSGLPLFELWADWDRERQIDFSRFWLPQAKDAPCSSHQAMLIYNRGYKAAGGYTEEDMKIAFQAGQDFYHEMSENLFPEHSFESTLRLLKKHPVAVVVNMKNIDHVFEVYRGDPEGYSEPFITYEPEVVDNYIQIKEVIYGTK